jgi:hypothetical protein
MEKPRRICKLCYQRFGNKEQLSTAISQSLSPSVPQSLLSRIINSSPDFPVTHFKQEENSGVSSCCVCIAG